MKQLKWKIIILFIFVIFILIGTVSLAVYQTTLLEENEEREEVILSQEEQETLNLVNEYRKQNGLTELKPSFDLQEVAKLKGEDLVNYGYFSHTSPNLGTPFEMLEQNGIKYKIAGENLAGNTMPRRAVDAWINSPSHRENILEAKFKYTGIYLIESPVYGKIFVQLFMS